LIAVASRSLEKAQAYATEWKIPKPYGSYQAMLESPDIDVIYNSLPNHLHAEWTIKALQAGKHVLCEKPIALSVAELNAMEDAANQQGLILAEAFMYRHHPQTVHVKEMVVQGVVGEIALVLGTFTFRLEDQRDIRMRPEMGGGSLWDVGCYPVSYSRMLLGAEPKEVFGWAWNGPTGVDEVFTGLMRFNGGPLVQFESGFRSPFRVRMEIVGTHGSLVIPDPFKPGTDNTIFIDRGGKPEKIKTPGQELYLGEVEDMADAVLNGKSPRISLEDSRANVKVLVALYESAKRNSPVAINQ
jgi:predicted dehydrogenase